MIFTVRVTPGRYKFSKLSKIAAVTVATGWTGHGECPLNEQVNHGAKMLLNNI